jgi:hypothetical protein
LELTSIYAVLDLSNTPDSECIKDVRESCDEINQTIDDYYYSTLIDRDELILDNSNMFNIYDLINSFEWSDINIDYNIVPCMKGDIKKIKYIINTFYYDFSSCIDIFLKKNILSPRSKIKRSNHLDLQNLYIRIKPIKQLDPNSLRYKIIKYLCNLMDGSINDYGNEVLLNLVLSSDLKNLNTVFSEVIKNILVWSDDNENWNHINSILDTLGIHAVHGSTKKRIKSYIKTRNFDAIIIDKSVPKPKGIKNAIYLLPKHTSETKKHILINISNFNTITCYNILKQIENNENSKIKSKSSSEPSGDNSEIKIMKTYVSVNDIKFKSLICKQIKTLNQNIVDNEKEADVIITEITKGFKVFICLQINDLNLISLTDT